VGGAKLIDGRAVAASLRQRVGEVAARLRQATGAPAGLATILVGEDPASRMYVAAKARACSGSGIAAFDIRLPADISQIDLVARIEELNRDDSIDGILVQLPLPSQIEAEAITAATDPAKDVDGFHPLNVGRLWSGAAGLVPCTPQGCMVLLQTVHRELRGADAVVLGRSKIVGRPMAALLLAADCTLTIAHSQTADAPAICRRAAILIAATGRPGMVKADWVKPGATVIDVGINPVLGSDGKNRLVGDVDLEVRAVAGAMTPVPGGVGPMTIACLLKNTVLAACRRRGLPDPAF
jgi:methylenetetrahydrofolate dehydrogenase (NADP+) / methenyltetrahydrofolate cyclohydrolase